MTRHCLTQHFINHRIGVLAALHFIVLLLVVAAMSKRDKQKEKDKESKEREKQKEEKEKPSSSAGAVRRSAKGVKRKAELEGSPRKAKFKKVPKKSFAECQERVSKGGWTGACHSFTFIGEPVEYTMDICAKKGCGQGLVCVLCSLRQCLCLLFPCRSVSARMMTWSSAGAATLLRAALQGRQGP